MFTLLVWISTQAKNFSNSTGSENRPTEFENFRNAFKEKPVKLGKFEPRKTRKARKLLLDCGL